MKNLKYDRTEIKKYAVKGVLSTDGKTITYLDDDKNEANIALSKCFEPFGGGEISLTITNKFTEDLSEEE